MTLNIQRFTSRIVSVTLLAAALAAGHSRATAADSSTSAEKQRKFISVLQSDAPPGDKAIACKRLAVYGTKDAVPVLAPLLLDADLSSWARIALEAIPDPAADDALRDAMTKAQGRLLVGVINSIGFRHDAKATDGLVAKLKEADPEVVSAAAVALGHIGGDPAGRSLEQCLAGAPAGVRSAVAEGCILCAEGYLTAGKLAAAVKLYDVVRKADVPKQRILEATRGAILARQSAGMPLLVEQLRSADKALFGIGLRTARELPGQQVSEALAVEMGRSSPERQPMLLLALADRRDAGVLPAVLEAARSGPEKVRIVAVGLLERLGNVSTVPVLLVAAAESNRELAQSAKSVLTRLPGKEVDADLLVRLPQASGKTRQVLIELAGLRRIEQALPAIVGSAQDADAGVRGAAVQAIGVLGGETQAADLVRFLQKTQDAKERAEIEEALLAVGGRAGPGCVPLLLPLVRSGDGALRVIGLHALAGVGGPDALAAVQTALTDKEESVQTEAVRTLSSWPNSWPEDVGAADTLLTLAKSGKTTSHRVLALRGYLQYVQEARKLTDDERLAKVNSALPLATRAEEKRLAVSVLGAIGTARALELLVMFADDPAVTEEACSALVSLAGKNLRGVSTEERQKVLQTVMEKSKNDATKKRATDALKKIK
jgi:HEAT repeat protein